MNKFLFLKINTSPVNGCHGYSPRKKWEALHPPNWKRLCWSSIKACPPGYVDLFHPWRDGQRGGCMRTGSCNGGKWEELVELSQHFKCLVLLKFRGHHLMFHIYVLEVDNNTNFYKDILIWQQCCKEYPILQVAKLLWWVKVIHMNSAWLQVLQVFQMFKTVPAND